MKMCRKGLLVVVFLLPLFVNAQRWKLYRYEFSGGIGAANFLGELGGANQIGTNYFRDLEMKATRPAFYLALRYKLSEYFALKTNFIYGKVFGDDALTQEFYRNYRNLSFRSPIIELATKFEGAWMKEQISHRYKLKGVKGQKGFELYTYMFVGFGFFYFNPKAEFNGTWHALRKLSTEGQGLVPTRRKYMPVQPVIPVGIGFKYTIDRKWGVNLEYGLRKTFTDYIDDVSKTYIDPDLLRELKGDLAVTMADRSDKSQPNITDPLQQRGDPRDKDAYMFLTISVTYKLRTGRDNLPKF